VLGVKIDMKSDQNVHGNVEGAHHGAQSFVQVSAVAGILAVVMYALDVALPLGVAAGVPYVALVLMGLWFPRAHHIYILAGIGSALTALGYFTSPIGGEYWVVLTNRGLALLVIWTAAFLLVSRKKFEDDLEAARDNLESEITRRVSELKISEARFRAVSESAADAIITADKKGLIIHWNQGAENLFGYTPTEIIGEPLTVLIPDRYKDGHTNGFERVMGSGDRHREIGRATG